MKDGMRLFYTGQFINVELLEVMLEKHGIDSAHEFTDDDPGDDDELSRQTKVYVPEADYDRAYQLFYADREDEI